jgi:hypothetical protein
MTKGDRQMRRAIPAAMSFTRIGVCGIVAVALFVPPAVAGVIASSTFDTGADGWRTTGDIAPNPQRWLSAGGNPGGFIQADDILDGVFFYWQAPAKFLGNDSAGYGGKLRFDERQHFNLGERPNQAMGSNLILQGAGLTLVWSTSTTPAVGDVYNPPPFPTGGTWTTFNVPLVETDAGWNVGSASGPPPTQAQMQAVLGSLTSLTLRAEYQFGDDHDDLDNVILSTNEASPQTNEACYDDGTERLLGFAEGCKHHLTAPLTFAVCEGLRLSAI